MFWKVVDRNVEEGEIEKGVEQEEGEEKEIGREIRGRRGEYKKREWSFEKREKSRRKFLEKENISPEIVEYMKIRIMDEINTSERTGTLEKRTEASITSDLEEIKSLTGNKKKKEIGPFDWEQYGVNELE